MNEKLKPCPFCGSLNVGLRHGTLFSGAVHCNNCSADVAFGALYLFAEDDPDWKSVVINGWNRRADS